MQAEDQASVAQVVKGWDGGTSVNSAHGELHTEAGVRALLVDNDLKMQRFSASEGSAHSNLGAKIA